MTVRLFSSLLLVAAPAFLEIPVAACCSRRSNSKQQYFQSELATKQIQYIYIYIYIPRVSIPFFAEMQMKYVALCVLLSTSLCDAINVLERGSDSLFEARMKAGEMRALHKDIDVLSSRVASGGSTAR